MGLLHTKRSSPYASDAQGVRTAFLRPVLGFRACGPSGHSKLLILCDAQVGLATIDRVGDGYRPTNSCTALAFEEGWCARITRRYRLRSRDKPPA